MSPGQNRKSCKALNTMSHMQTPGALRIPMHLQRLFYVFLLTLVILLPCNLAYADFQDGLDAYNRGDYASALKEWHPLAEQGHVIAQTKLGVMFQQGNGVPQDFQEAVRWLTLAAEQGNMWGQHFLGLNYYTGQGVQQDYNEAARWCRLAAEQNLAEAQITLGYYYDLGHGVRLDKKEAVHWYRLAAEQGLVPAQIKLGILYARGEDISQDVIESHKWLYLAAEQGDASAQRMRDLMAGHLTRAQIAEAERLALGWLTQQKKNKS